MYEYIVPGVMVAVCALIDVKTRSLPVWIIVLGGIAGGVVSYVTGSLNIRDILFGSGVGMIILLFGFFSRQAIGYGDALLFMAVGAGIGLWKVVFLMWISFMAAGLFGLLIMITKHKNRNYELPFVPFLGGAYALMICMEVLA